MLNSRQGIMATKSGTSRKKTGAFSSHVLEGRWRSLHLTVNLWVSVRRITTSLRLRLPSRGTQGLLSLHLPSTIYRIPTGGFAV